MKTESIVLSKSVVMVAEGFAKEESFGHISEAQRKVRGFDQDKFSQAAISIEGCGGLGSEVAYGLARKGIGGLYFYDMDYVTPSNLTRQFYFPSQFNENKAVALARNLLPHCSYPTRMVAYPMSYQDAVDADKAPDVDIDIVGPDNDMLRVYTSRRALHRNPVIFLGVAESAEHGYVFVQKPGEACFGCLFPDAVGSTRMPCPGSPAVLDILRTVAGLALRAVDSVLMTERAINWNYYTVHLEGVIPTQAVQIEKNEKCPICGTQEVQS